MILNIAVNGNMRRVGTGVRVGSFDVGFRVVILMPHFASHGHASHRITAYDSFASQASVCHGIDLGDGQREPGRLETGAIIQPLS